VARREASRHTPTTPIETPIANAGNLLGRVDSLVADFQKNPKKYINVQFRVF
jgi:hypothetical protein